MSRLQNLVYTGILLTGLSVLFSGCSQKFPAGLKENVEDKVDELCRRKESYILQNGFGGAQLEFKNRTYLLKSLSTSLKEGGKASIVVKATKARKFGYRGWEYSKGDTSYCFEIETSIRPVRVTSIKEERILIED